MYLKTSHKKMVYIILTALLLFISFICFLSLKNSNTSTLIGKWKSLETGDKICFTEKGTVEIQDEKQIGRYTILSSTKMEYTINDKTFTMYYKVEGQKLLWGTDETKLEPFKRSLFFN